MNTWSAHFCVFTECAWNEDLGRYVTDRRMDFSFSMYTRSWECFVYALRRLLSEARIARTDDWFLYIDGESSAVGSSQCLAFIVLRGGEVLTSLPYAHLYIAENCVYRHSRIIWGILYQSGIGIAGWDDVTDTWWMFADYEVVSLFDAEGVVHTLSLIHI